MSKLKTIGVQFNPVTSAFKTYHYFTRLDVAEGQTVVVDSPQNGYVCAKVMTVEDGLSSKAVKPIVTVVDDGAYKAELLAQDKRDKILKELAVIEKKTSDVQRFAHLAALDPRAKELLDSLTELNK